MIEYKIFENILPKAAFQEIKILLTASNFPYFYAPSTDGMDGVPMFCHILVQNNEVNSESFGEAHRILQPLFKVVKDETGFNTIVRIKVNMYMNHGEQKEMGIHTDFPNSQLDYYTGVFNLTECNGYTGLIVGDKEVKVPSKENQFILFHGDTPHYGVTPSDKQNRLIINFDFIKSEEEE